MVDFIRKLWRRLIHLYERMSQSLRYAFSYGPRCRADIICAGGQPVIILCTQHVVFVARLLEFSLLKFGVKSIIKVGAPDNFGPGPYIVICPHMFKWLPRKYIAYQLEQMQSTRWQSAGYSKIFRRAGLILDYSKANIDYWQANGFAADDLLYYPIDYLPNIRVDSRGYEYDVVFYGDPSSMRRQKFLNALTREFNVKIVSSLFGDALYRLLSRAKVVVNIHYYEDARLETTRLYEVLSVSNAIVVSERGAGRSGEERLGEIVDFVDIGDVESMISKIRGWLSCDDERIRHLETVRKALHERENFAVKACGQMLQMRQNI